MYCRSSILAEAALGLEPGPAGSLACVFNYYAAPLPSGPNTSAETCHQSRAPAPSPITQRPEVPTRGLCAQGVCVSGKGTREDPALES